MCTPCESVTCTDRERIKENGILREEDARRRPDNAWMLSE